MNQLYQKFSHAVSAKLDTNVNSVVQLADLPPRHELAKTCVSIQGVHAELTVEIISENPEQFEKDFLALIKIFDGIFPVFKINQQPTIDSDNHQRYGFEIINSQQGKREIIFTFSGQFSAIEEQNMRLFAFTDQQLQGYLVVSPQDTGEQIWFLQLDSLSKAFQIKLDSLDAPQKSIFSLVKEIALDQNYRSLPRIVLGTVSIPLAAVFEFLSGVPISVNVPNHGKAAVFGAAVKTINYHYADETHHISVDS
jgi:hypothetical protein